MKRRRGSTSGEVSILLANSSNIEGKISFKGQARLDGVFKGEIFGDGTLIVGPNAMIEARITATAVEISGSVVGDIEVQERIELRAPGKLVGNIIAPLVVMDEGVVFEGNCRMASDSGDGGSAPKVRLISNDNK